MQKLIKKIKDFKRKKYFLSAFLSIAPILISACASPVQSLIHYSVQVGKKRNLKVFPTTQHSENFFKSPIQLNASKVDKRYENYYGNISPELILQGRQYRALINNLTVKQIRDDLLDSLIEIVNNNQNISIDFSQKNNIVRPFNLTFNTQNNLIINAFQMIFTINNSSINSYNLMDGIEIFPQSTAQVKISIPQANVIPSYSVSNDNTGQPNAYAAAWNLQARAFNFRVNLKYMAGSYQGKEISLQPEKIKFLTSRSFALNRFYSQFVTLPDYSRVRSLAIKAISNLTSEEIVKDINDWYTTYFRFQAYKGWKDIELILKYLLSFNQIDNNGKPTNLIKILVDDPGRRKKIFSKISISEVLKNLVLVILNERDGYTPPSAAQVEQFIKDCLDMGISEFLNKGFQIQVIWNELPKIDSSDPFNPRISYNYDVKTTFNQDFSFWLNNVSRINAQNAQIKLENKQNPSAKKTLIPMPSKDKQYDFYKYVNIKNLIAAIGMEPTESQELGNFVGNLSDLIELERLHVSKGESVTFGFKATNSHLDFVANPSLDAAKSFGENFGWQASDTTMTMNLSKIPSFWKEIYKKMNAIDYSTTLLNGGLSDISNFSKFQEEIKKMADEIKKSGNISNIFKILSLLFVDPKFKNKSNLPRSEREIRPVEKLFDALLATTFTIKSMPNYVNLSRAFYYLPDFYKGVALWTKSDSKDLKNAKAIYTSNPKISIFDLVPTANDESIQVNESLGNEKNIQNYSDQITFNLIWKNSLLHNYNLNYSSNLYGPKSLILKTDTVNEAIDQLIANAKTNADVYALEGRIVDIIKRNLVNPDGTTNNKVYTNFSPKVSLVRVPLADSLNTVFQMPIKDPLQKWISLVHVFNSSALNIQGIAENVFDRDAYLLIVNTQITGNFFSWDKNGVLSDGARPILFKLIPPLLDFAKIKIPSL